MPEMKIALSIEEAADYKAIQRIALASVGIHGERWWNGINSLY